MDLNITVGDMIRWGLSQMRKANVDYLDFGNPDLSLTACYLTFFALNLPYDYKNPIYLNGKLHKDEVSAVKDIFNKRIKERLPTPYITNECWFGPLSPQPKFYINEDVFVPRSPFVHYLKDFMQEITWTNHKVLDLCTGSGVMGIILALINPNIQVELADICPKALKVAQININNHNLEKRVKCIQSNLFNSIKNKYDFIITVPPQLSVKEYKNIPVESFHEPELSLRSGKDGLKHIQHIIDEGPDYLNPEGMLAAEIGPRLPDVIKSRYSHLKLKWLKFKNEEWIFSLKK